jgi:predicted DNA-binding protein|tara:strand:- start:25 stop:198 length:174 start_codon:yes stop_codon:yes gene_type:complete
MDTSKYKSIALSVETYRRLRELSDKFFEMPQSLAKTASFFVNKAHKDFKENGKSPRA